MVGTGTGPDKTPDASVDDSSDGLNFDAVAPDAYGELRRRVADSPLRFSFTWRETEFRATVEAGEDGLRLTLQNNLGVLPYSAEDKNRRDCLLAVVDTHKGNSTGKLRVVHGQDIILEGGIELPEESGNTVNNIVSTLTVLVLRAAPQLDLLAERATAIDGLKSTSH